MNSFWRDIPDSPELKFDDWRSFEYTRKKGGGDCDNWAICSIVCGYKRGYPAKMMYIHALQEYDEGGEKKERQFDHAVHLLEKDGLYGLSERANPIPVEFVSVGELMEYYAEKRGLVSGHYEVVELQWVDGLIDAKENLRPYFWKNSVKLEDGIIPLER
ncbi:MAG: hypothetical protein KJ718_01545 [Nanoarchaeota archaeon]|nr:hypothetical protein [Nanoarchaeota archaeon]MBU1051218.1 hypothetical protein [Nanoarchaeota archaeon]MBU1988063.1 hypothetical protein [Nanoarchaeota archaeon]